MSTSSQHVTQNKPASGPSRPASAALQRAATPPLVQDVLRSSGQPLDSETRAFMESRFDYDFSRVQVHADHHAAESARAVDARAYTVGQHVVFGRSQYSPHTTDGRTLLAHELTHTIQQPAFTDSDLASLRVSDPHEASERAADTAADEVMSGDRVTTDGHREVGIARAPCWTGSRCATPHASATAAANQVFSAAPQLNARAKRRALCTKKDPACTADGHGARATELEKILDHINPIRPAGVRGVFVDKDFPSGAAAFKAGCQEFEVNLGGELHPFDGARTGSCVFFPQSWEDEAREFNTTQNATIGGKTREMWTLNTRRELMHETEHARFDETVTLSGPTKGPCTFDNLQSEFSEISARMAEFPLVFRDIRAIVEKSIPASPLPPRSALEDVTWKHPLFQTWLTNRLTSEAESIKGSVKAVRCACPCDQADKFIRETASQAMDAPTVRWTESEKTRFNGELRQPKWGLDWPLDYSNLKLEPVPDLPGRSESEGKLA
jgi:Domain of unknown function (DUF4157)